MDSLLDTHTLLWFLAGSPEIPEIVLEILRDPQNTLSVSIVSLWEVAIKVRTGRLPLSGSLSQLASTTEAQHIAISPIRIEALQLVSEMPFPLRDHRPHKDPFGRIIAATALVSGLTLLSADTIFDAYGVQRLWD
jgi:PIN domain nuclease of toxin-antitoxin system